MRLASAALLAALALAGCGGGDDASDRSGAAATTVVSTAPTPSWNGPPEPAEDGTISVAGFNEYAKTLPPEKRVPRELAIEFLQVQQPYTVTMDTRPGGSTVTILQDNLEDDSVRARRHTLEFGLFSGGEVSLGSARVDYKCQQNRGHQDFSAELCL